MYYVTYILICCFVFIFLNLHFSSVHRALELGRLWSRLRTTRSKVLSSWPWFVVHDMTWHDALLYTQVKCFDWATQATKQGFSDFWTQLFEFNAMLVEQNTNRSRIKRVKLQQGAMANVWNAEMSLGWYMMIRACKPCTSSKKVKNHGTTGDNHLSAFSLQLDCPWRSPPAWHLLRSSPNSLGRCDLTFSLALI